MLIKYIYKNLFPLKIILLNYFKDIYDTTFYHIICYIKIWQIQNICRIRKIIIKLNIVINNNK